jgi:uncharacterized membrane protein
MVAAEPRFPPRPSLAAAILRGFLCAFYALAGVIHLAVPQPFIAIVPPWVPEPNFVVAATGVAELFGAAGVAQGRSPRLRRAAAWGLALYALCVWPANFHHMTIDLARPDHGLGLAYHIPRLAAQPLLIWLALWTGELLRWPFPADRRSPAD